MLGWVEDNIVFYLYFFCIYIWLFGESLMAKTRKLRKKLHIDDEILLIEELLKEEMYEQSEKSLYNFFVNFWQCYSPESLVTNWHIECLTAHIHAALKRDIRRLCISIPPRSSKSTTSSISACPFWWINNPEEKFWLISHSHRLVTQNLLYSRRIMEHPLYKDRWCNPEDSDNFRFSLAKDQNTKARLENSAGGYLLGSSITSTALGLGYSVAILDDVLDSEESNSITAIEQVNNWFDHTFLNRSNNPKTDVVIIVAQRLHQKDIIGHVTEKYADQNWFNLVMPSRYDPARTFISPIGFNDKRTKKNELLDPIRLPDDFLQMQAKDYLVYQTRYQQNPESSATGNLVKAEWITLTPHKPIIFSCILTVWDLSFTDNPTSSYTVGTVFGLSNDEVYIIDMWRHQADIPTQLEAIRKMKRKYKDSVVAVEKKANGHAVMAMLRREIPDIYPLDPTLFGGDKSQRLGSTLPLMKNGKFFIYDPIQVDTKLEPTYSIDVIKKELLGFPLVSNDDIVDTIGYGLQYLQTWGQNNIALITKGSKIQIAEEDFINPERHISLEPNITDDYLIFVDTIPDRSDLFDIFN